jgi:hypothetical protein
VPDRHQIRDASLGLTEQQRHRIAGLIRLKFRVCLQRRLLACGLARCRPLLRSEAFRRGNLFARRRCRLSGNP